MHQLQFATATLCTLVLGLAVPLSSTAQSAANLPPCAQITAACKNAGFAPGGASNGTGLQADCIAPIMQGTAPPSQAQTPLPKVDPQLIAACKAKNPRFGQEATPAPNAAVRSSPAHPAPSAANGAAATNANGNAGVNSSAGTATGVSNQSGQVAQTDAALILNTGSALTTDQKHEMLARKAKKQPKGADIKVLATITPTQMYLLNVVQTVLNTVDVVASPAGASVSFGPSATFQMTFNVLVQPNYVYMFDFTVSANVNAPSRVSSPTFTIANNQTSESTTGAAKGTTEFAFVYVARGTRAGFEQIWLNSPNAWWAFDKLEITSTPSK